MKNDFWPDEVIVIGKYNGKELAFTITAKSFFENRIETEIKPSLNALRLALWGDGDKGDNAHDN